MKLSIATSILLASNNCNAFTVPSSKTFVSSLVSKNPNNVISHRRREEDFYPMSLLKMSETATPETSTETEPETFAFQAEVGRVMDIIINSLYSNRDVFLRELTSNASDACDKKRFLSLTADSSSTSAPPEIRIKSDKTNNILTIEDSGVGMTRDELMNNLGSIAQSGTKKFLEALGSSNKDDTLNLIGQFGVGFYSSYLVADKVSVITKSMTDDKVYKWESSIDEEGVYSISEITDSKENYFKSEGIASGSRLMLHLKEDALEYLEPSKLKTLLNKYSEFVEFPIFLFDQKTEYESVPDEEANKDLKEGDEPKMKTVPKTTEGYEQLNNQKPIWLRSASDVTEEEYTEFYKTAFRSSYDEPMTHTHFALEGSVSCKSLLYIPGMLPYELSKDMFDEEASTIRLYVKRVFINDKFEGLIPRWLKFIRGVVDSDDLPLNVGREILQRTKALTIIRKRLVKKSLDMIRDLEKISEDAEEGEDDAGKYIMFWNNFGKYMKVGVVEDDANRKEIAPLLRFFSSKSGEEYRSLDQYVDAMNDKQKNIYYLTSDSRDSAARSPVLEKLSSQGIEVLFMVEPLDEIAIQSLESYKEFKLADITKEGALDSILDDDEETSKDDPEAAKKKEEKKAKQEKLDKEWEKTTEFLEALLQGKINKAQVTTLLTSSPAALVQGAYGMSPTMQRYLKQQSVATGGNINTPGGYNQAILEINPDNIIVQDLRRKIEEDSSEKENFGMLLYDVAAMTSGYDVEDSTDFAKRVMKLMNSQAISDEEIRVEPVSTVDDPEEFDPEAVQKTKEFFGVDDESMKQSKKDDAKDDDDDVKVAKDVEVL